jgi:hypothetical protein
VLAPIVLAVLGADYLAPRNLVAAMIPFTVVIALLLALVDPRALGDGLAALAVLALLIVSIDVDLSPRLQRGNWRDLASAIERRGGASGSAGAGAGAVASAGTTAAERAITTVELGAAPLEYYLPRVRLKNLARGAWVRLTEIDETGYSPLRASAGRPPAPGFRLLERGDVDGLIYYRFVSSVPRLVPEARLRRNVITLAHPEVLVAAAAKVFAAPNSAR